MKTTAVTLCLGQADFLFQTAARNRAELDDMWVLTDEKDIQTLRVCDALGLNRYFIKEPYKSGIVSAGVAINEWLAYGPLNNLVSPPAEADWLLFLDADVWLPPGYRAELQSCSDRQGLYWVGRRMVINPTQWRAFSPMTGGNWPAIEREVREEWDPGIGFFQMFHSSMLPQLGHDVYNMKVFPEHMVTGRPGADREFATKFGRWHRLPKPVYHLGMPGKLNRGRDHPGWAIDRW